MRIIRRTFANLSKSLLIIGREGENHATKLEIDISKELSEFSEPSFELVLHMPATSDPYPVLVDIIGNKMVYYFSGSDLSKRGDGQIEALVIGENSELLKSTTARTRIEPSIIPNNYPGPIQKVIDDLKAEIGDIDGVETVDDLPENPKANAIVYVKNVGFYWFNGIEWVQVTYDNIEVSNGELSVDGVLNGIRIVDEFPETATVGSLVYKKGTGIYYYDVDTDPGGGYWWYLLVSNAWDNQIFSLNAKKHWHSNKPVLDCFSGTDDSVSYNGKNINLVEPNNITLLGFNAYTNLIVRDAAIPGESIQDVPIFVHGEGGYDICKLIEEKPGEEYDHVEQYDMIALREVRQYGTGMPLRIIRVMMGGHYSIFVPQEWNDSGSHTLQAGWYTDGEPSDAPTISFTPNIMQALVENGYINYNDISDLPDDILSELRSLSQCINVSASAMGTLAVPENALLRFAGSFEPNRKYTFFTDRDVTFTLPYIEYTETDTQCVLYLTCLDDIDISFAEGACFVGSAPNTDSGDHKLLFSRVPSDLSWAVGGLDYVWE